MKLDASARYKIVVLLVVSFFSALAISSYYFLKSEHRQAQEKELNIVLSDFSLSVVETVQQAVEKLRGVSLVVAYDEKIGYETFSRYVIDSLGGSQKWMIIEWQPIVASADREAFETDIQSRLFPDFSLWQPGEDGRVIPAENRDFHVPVLFMVASISAANTTGLDLSWSSSRMESKLLARDEGQAQLSGLFNVVLSPGADSGPIGFAITLPVFEDLLIPGEMSKRREKIKGFIAGVYSIEQLLKAQLGKLANDGYRLSISDVASSDTKYRWPVDADWQNSPGLGEQKIVSLYGRQWRIVVEPMPIKSNGIVLRTWIMTPLAIVTFAVIFLLIFRWLFKNNAELRRIEHTLAQTLERVKVSEQQFAEQASQDPLTGLFNRRAFFTRIEQEFERASRYEIPMTLLIIDVDNFKKINDTYGHPIGDKVLIKLAETCLQMARDSDIVCRFGGEEFVVLLVQTDLQEGLNFSERLRLALTQITLPIKESNKTVSFTVSGGLSEMRSTDTIQSLISRADKALYKAKGNGKNQILTEQ